MRRKLSWLVIATALLVAAAGVVYAHWQETLTVRATVSTGQALLLYNSASTNDDGPPGGWFAPGDDGGGTEYDHWGALSSNDPASFGYDGSETRLTKDVGRCWFTNVGNGTQAAELRIDNAYPGYHCTATQLYGTHGSIPMREQAKRVYACEVVNPGDCDDAGDFTEMSYDKPTNTFSLAGFPVVVQQGGPSCGYQTDPIPSWTQIYWGMGLLQAAAQPDQGASYLLRFELDSVNYNEWSLANCHGYKYYIDPTGTPAKPIP